MDTYNCKEQPKNQEDVARRKEVKEEEEESKNSLKTLLSLGLDQISKFIHRLALNSKYSN
jgi:hypothetical protein